MPILRSARAQRDRLAYVCQNKVCGWYATKAFVWKNRVTEDDSEECPSCGSIAPRVMVPKGTVIVNAVHNEVEVEPPFVEDDIADIMTPGEEIILIGQIKAAGREIGLLVDRVQAQAEHGRNRETDSHRWTAIARTDLQQGFMALVRAVAKPEGF